LEAVNEYDGGSSIKAMIARQEAAKYISLCFPLSSLFPFLLLLSIFLLILMLVDCDRNRREAERQAALSEKLQANREKEDKTMAMLRDMAAKKGYL